MRLTLTLTLSQATRRKVIMPRLWCWVDRYWNNLERGRFPGVSAEQHPLPFHCPFDHLFDLDKWLVTLTLTLTLTLTRTLTLNLTLTLTPT